MAERRMFTKKITDDDRFMELSASAQSLYFHLNMSADDDGFCNSVTMAMFKAHASVQDLQALLEKRYLLQFDNGVIVIKHWRMANALRKDRYTPTVFQEELAKLDIKENGVYSWLPDGCQMVADWLPDGCQLSATDKDRLDKDSIGKLSIGNIDNAPTPKLVKHKYGEYKNVLLTDDEFQKLADEIPDYLNYIERLSSYIASTGKKYKSHYATVRNWYRKDNSKPAKNSGRSDWIDDL